MPASGVERAYDAFANNQLRDSLSGYASFTGRMEQLADIDNMLADEADNVSVSLGNLFKDMATLSGDPADGPARAKVFSSLDVLAGRYRDSAKRLSGTEKVPIPRLSAAPKRSTATPNNWRRLTSSWNACREMAHRQPICSTSVTRCWKG